MWISPCPTTVISVPSVVEIFYCQDKVSRWKNIEVEVSYGLWLLNLIFTSVKSLYPKH